MYSHRLALEVLAFGCIAFAASAFTLEISMFLFVLIPVLAIEIFRSRWKSGRQTFAIVTCAVSVSASALVLLFAASYLPAKNQQRLLAKSIHFKSEKITLAEFKDYCEENRAQFPVYISLRFAARSKDIEIQCPNNSISIRDLVAAFDRLAGLQHRFSGCGNSWTLLGGGECSILMVWDPKIDGPNAEPEYDRDTK